MYRSNWTPPPPHWGRALQGGLAHIGAALMDNDDARKRRQRETMLDERDQQRYETSLRMTPGVSEIAPAEPTHSTRRSIIDPSNPGRTLQQVNLPGVSGAIRAPRGQTMLTDTLAFNPNHQQDRETAERDRRLKSVTDALIAEGETPERAAARAGVIVEGADISYRGPATETGFMDQQRKLAGIPRWTPPPQPQLIVTEQDGRPTYESVTPGQVPRGSPPTAQGRDPFARELPSFDTVFDLVKADERWAELPVEQRLAVTRDILAGRTPREPQVPTFLQRRGDASEFLLPPALVGFGNPRSSFRTDPAQGSPGGDPSIAPPPRTAAATPAPAGAPAPTGMRDRAVLDQALQFYAPLPADQREVAMREDGATGPEIQYMLSKIGR
jgi:hypothetical protein